MNALIRKITIANNGYYEKIEALRYLSYCSSRSFKVIDTNELMNYCKWSATDDNATVLLALNDAEKPICTLRGNVYHSKAELDKFNPIFSNYNTLKIEYPVLDLTIAATHPDYFNSGILQALRYHMYLQFRDKVKSLTGVVVNHSSLFNLLTDLNYEFTSVHTLGKDIIPCDKWMIATMNIDKIEFALEYLLTKYRKVINDYPFHVN